MGSYDYTCAVSGLPIGCGEKIRYMLITSSPYNDFYQEDKWFPRTFPIRAEYNDYGSVQNVQDGVAKNLWMEGFQTDLISLGTGENSYHDIPTSKDMSFDDMIRALVSGRLRVIPETDIAERSKLNKKFRGLTPKGVPTLQRTKKILQKNSLRIVKQSYSEPESGFLIDKIRYGQIRIRFSPKGENDYGKDVERLTSIQPLFDKKYVTALTAGRGLDHAELLIFVRPGTKDFYGHPKDSKKPLQVNHMMIREDVWQKLLLLKVVSQFKKKLSLQDYKDSIYEFYIKCQDFLSDKNNIINSINLDFALRRANKEPYNDLITSWICKSEVPFTVGLGEHWLLLCEKKLSLDEAKPILDDIAEFVHVWNLLNYIRWSWRPSNSIGPQYGEWKEHQRFVKTLLTVINAKLA